MRSGGGYGTCQAFARCEAHPYMIGSHMNRMSQRSRALLSTCVYLFAVVSIIGGAFAATTVLSSSNPVLAASADTPAKKIGPGYARMQPVDLGKPEKIAYSPPHDPHSATPPALSPRRPPPAVRAAITPIMVAPVSIAAPLTIAEAVRPAYTPPDIHRIY